MAGNPITDPNWARELADTVDRIVGKVRDTTTDNIVLVARALVFGLFIAIVGIFTLVIFLVAVTRGLQALLELAVEWPRAVYLSYLILGGILCALGGLMMSKRRASDT
ncbi:MAG: hypothetical protein WD225_07915 [Ilumatobacteraceae bacterium]